MKAEIGKILQQWCGRKAIEMIGLGCCPGSVSEIVGYLKNKSYFIIFDRHANLKYKYGNRMFWCGGYDVDIVGKKYKKDT